MQSTNEMRDYYEKVKSKTDGEIAANILLELLGRKEDKENKEKEQIYIEDPEYLFSSAFDEIREEMRRVMIKRQIDDKELEVLIKKEHPAKYHRLWGELYERINTDIWGKYDAGVLTQEELERWKERLGQWKGEWLEILKSITNGK